VDERGTVKGELAIANRIKACGATEGWGDNKTKEHT